MPARCAWRCAPTWAAASPACGTAHLPVLRCTEPGALDGARAVGLLPAGAVLQPPGATGASAGRAWTTAPSRISTTARIRCTAWAGCGPGRSSRPARVDVVLRYRHAADADWPFAFEARQYFTLTPQAHARADGVRPTWPTSRSRWAWAGTRTFRSARAAGCTSSSTAAGTATPRSCRCARWRSRGIDSDVAHLDYDNCFDGWRGAARIRDEKLSLQLSSSLDRLVVYTPQQRDYFCVEPVSHVSNAIHMADPLAHGLRRVGARRIHRGLDAARRGACCDAAARTDRRPARGRGRRPACWANRRCGTRASRCCTTATSRAAAAALRPAQRRSARHWDFDTEPSAVAPLPDGRLLLALRSGIWRFDPASGARERLAEPPYDAAQPALQRRQVRCRGALLGRHDLRAARPGAGHDAVLRRRQAERSASTA